MGWNVISFVGIDTLKLTDELEKEIKKLLKTEPYSNYCRDNRGLWTISFELSGNKAVDYTVLDKIKELLSKEKLSFSIRANEYCETDGGYFFDSEED